MANAYKTFEKKMVGLMPDVRNDRQKMPRRDIQVLEEKRRMKRRKRLHRERFEQVI